MLLQYAALTVDGVGEGDRRGAEHEREELDARLERIHGDAQEAQRDDDADERDQKRVEERGLHLLIEKDRKLEDAEGYERAENEDRGQREVEIDHGPYASISRPAPSSVRAVRRARRSIRRWTAMTV